MPGSRRNADEFAPVMVTMRNQAGLGRISTYGNT